MTNNNNCQKFNKEFINNLFYLYFIKIQNDLYIHLTNYSVFKYNDNFEKFEYGNEISFDELQKSLSKYYNLEINVRKDIYQKLKI